MKTLKINENLLNSAVIVAKKVSEVMKEEKTKKPKWNYISHTFKDCAKYNKDILNINAIENPKYDLKRYCLCVMEAVSVVINDDLLPENYAPVKEVYKKEIEKLKTMPEFQNVECKTNEELRAMNAGWYTNELLVITPIMYDLLENDVKLQSINDEIIKREDIKDFDTRFGCMAYGFPRKYEG